MYHSACLVALVTSLLWSIASATDILPRGYHADSELEALVQIRNVILKPRSLDGTRNTPIARRWHGSSAAQEQTSSPLTAVKRTLLGLRQLECDPGYGLCHGESSATGSWMIRFSLKQLTDSHHTDSGRCCPDNGNGGCCDDGTCVTKDETCCNNGGACETGLTCCGASTCAPQGGECCSDGGSCDPGLHCVVLHGVKGCCEDLSCTSFGSGGVAGGGADPSFTITPISIPSVTIPSFTPISFTPISFTPISFPPVTIPSFTPISITPISLPSITVPTGAVGGDLHYSYYTSTWTFYFYTFFLTTIPVSTTKTTSSRVTTTTELTAYATDTADADEQFGSITADYASITAAISIPTSLGGGGAANTGTTSPLRAGGGSAPTGSAGSGASSGGSASGDSSGSSSGAASGGTGITDQLSRSMMFSILGIIGVGVLALWL